MHILRSYLQNQPVTITLIGVGGTGSRVLIGLKNLHLGLLALGHPGLTVVAYDPDTVSTSNLVRQHFYADDVGKNKAVTLIERINYTCNLNWKGYPWVYQRPRSSPGGLRIGISCVDTRKARKDIYGHLQGRTWEYLLDFGNDQHTGQVVLGGSGLPTALDLFPEIADTSLPEDNTPSCSALESLMRQDLFINETLAVAGLNLLWTLLHKKELSHHGVFVNLQTGTHAPLKVPQEQKVAH